jgi:hypothetical protein
MLYQLSQLISPFNLKIGGSDAKKEEKRCFVFNIKKGDETSVYLFHFITFLPLGTD